MTRRRLILLGSTGSIGVSTLEVVEHLNRLDGPMRYDVVGLAAGASGDQLADQATRFDVSAVALADHKGARPLQSLGGPRVLLGNDAAHELIDQVARPDDLVVSAMVGAAGLPATLAAIERGCDVALANKETLVAAGPIVMEAARRAGVRILPIDSEHNALLQCIPADGDVSPVRRIIVTASGGPFRTWSVEAVQAATVEQALDHPTWNMGRKVTIDSATMVNKALEVIEAHWLFGLPGEQIEVLVHPQSVVHGLVEYVDGSTIAQLGAPDMRTPIQHALTWPLRTEGCSRRLDWRALSALDFAPPDASRFPALPLAYDVIRHGGTSGAVFNAANEVAVEAFLGRRLAFGGISRVIAEAMAAVPAHCVRTLDDVLAADKQARSAAAESIRRLPVESVGVGGNDSVSSPAGTPSPGTSH